MKEMYLTPNQYSRPGTPMKEVKGIVIHYVGNPESTAIANRNYFESLKNQDKTYASSHYIVGLEGEVIACVPENEVAYHASQANGDHIGIEVCHPDASGRFRAVTYEALIGLVITICKRYHLNPLRDVIRHYDVTGKNCPNYYVEHIDEWDRFRQEVHDKMPLTKTRIRLNGKLKVVDTINIAGYNYVKLRDLSDQYIGIDYDNKEKVPIVKVK